MRQVQYAYESSDDFYGCMQELRDTVRDDEHIMFQIFSDQVDKKCFTQVATMIEEFFPKSVYFGCTTCGNLVNGETVEYISVICTVFDKIDTAVKVRQYNLEDGIDSITADILFESKHIDNLKAIELYFSISDISHSSFCKKLEDLSDGIHVFGAISTSLDISSNDSLVYSKGNPISDNALVVAFYSGEELYVESLKATGWKPIGKQFEITKADGQILYELDGTPAYNIYKKYLNIDNNEMFFENTLEFPLFYEDNDEEILKVPVTSNPDNSITMSAEVEKGKMVRLSYGDPQSILKAIDEDVDILREFTPDIIRIFSCGARRTFWGKNAATFELEPLKGIANSSGFFSHGEFIKTKNHLNKHNVTLVLAAMREGEVKEGIYDKAQVYKQNSKKIPLITRLSTFITETTNQMNEANEKLNQEREHYHNVLTTGCEYNITGDLTEGVVYDWTYNGEGDIQTSSFNTSEPMTFDECIAYYLNMHKIRYVNQTKREIGNELTTREFMKKSRRYLTRDGLLSQFEKGVARTETVFYDSDRDMYIRISVYMSENADNGHVFALILVQDVTKQWNTDIEHERQLREAIELANQASVAKTSFLAHMSHEIRTPINAILGFNEMILRENKDENVEDYSKDVKNAAETLLLLVNDVLDFSKIEAGKMDLLPMNYSLPNMLSSVIGMMTGRAEQKSLALYLNCDKPLPEILYGDSGRIQQILINLLSNAIKYTEKGTVTLDVKAAVNDDVADIRFSVKDTGIGIKKEDINRLFNEFERIDVKKNRNIEGTGLGINITTGLLKLMDSKLEVTSQYGDGSEFAFTIKQKIVKKSENNEDKNESPAKRKIRFKAPNLRMLIVDDNAVNLKILTNLLKETEVKLDQAHSGLECIEMVRTGKYDIVILDHMMPVMDGIETLECMKKEKLINTDNTPVIAFTANAIAGIKEMYLECGFSDYLTKPVRPNDLNAMIIKHAPVDKVIEIVE